MKSVTTELQDWLKKKKVLGFGDSQGQKIYTILHKFLNSKF